MITWNLLIYLSSCISISLGKVQGSSRIHLQKFCRQLPKTSADHHLPQIPIASHLMAQTLRRPLCSVVGLTSTFERRCFSQIVPRQGGVSRKFQVGRPAQSPEKSFRIASKEAMRLPSDVGLLERTFSSPLRSEALTNDHRNIRCPHRTQPPLTLQVS